ncbi:MAG: GNAT family N-acetyltransferase [Pseudomonadota bacterium]
MLPRIRHATLSDIAGIAEVHVKSWQTIYRGIVPNEFLNNLSIPTQTKRWEGLIHTEEADILVAEVNNLIIGFISFCSPRMRIADTPFAIELGAMYILPNKWRQGIGRLLFNEAIKEFQGKGYKKILLWVFEKNTQGRLFYKSMGFTEIDFALDDWSGVPLKEILCQKQLIE